MERYCPTNDSLDNEVGSSSLHSRSVWFVGDITPAAQVEKLILLAVRRVGIWRDWIKLLCVNRVQASGEVDDKPARRFKEFASLEDQMGGYMVRDGSGG